MIEQTLEQAEQYLAYLQQRPALAEAAKVWGTYVLKRKEANCESS